MYAVRITGTLVVRSWKQTTFMKRLCYKKNKKKNSDKAWIHETCPNEKTKQITLPGSNVPCYDSPGLESLNKYSVSSIKCGKNPTKSWMVFPIMFSLYCNGAILCSH